MVSKGKSRTTKLRALLHSFFDSKKKIKIPKENASKRIESNKTKVFKRKETNGNISTSKENNVKLINKKETKDKAFNSKADDKISKSKEAIKRPFSESDTDESDSLKKKKTDSNKFKRAFLYKERFNGEWCKEWSFIQPCKEDPHAFFCTVCSEKKAVHIKLNSYFFFLSYKNYLKGYPKRE